MNMECDEASVKKIITSILTSSPLVLTIRDLAKDYRNTIGEMVPYQQLGFKTFEFFLRSVPDIVQVNGSGPTAEVLPVITEKSAHINKLVTNQRVNQTKKKQVIQKRPKIFYPAGHNAPRKYSGNYSNSATPKPPQTYDYPIKKEPPKTYSPTSSSDRFNSNTHSAASASYNVSPSNNYNNSHINVSNSNKSSEVSQLNCNVNSGKLKSIVSDLDRISTQKVESSVPIHIRNNLRSLIMQCPEGIWCAEVPEKYRKMFGQELDYEQLGFKSLIQLCICLPSIFHYVRPSVEDYKLYDRQKPLPKCAEKSFTIASYNKKNKSCPEVEWNAPLPDIQWEDVMRFLPQDIFKHGEEIPRAFISHDVQEGDNIDVCTGEIYDLSKFWIYLKDSALEELMDDIQDFYQQNADKYKIPDHLIKEGIYCVQVILGEYHRALIVDTLPEVPDTVRVVFIDFGTMMKVPSKGLCYLHITFSHLPAQAIRCRLASVVPPVEGAPWSREACKAFRRLVTQTDLKAKISRINWDDQFLEVYLADVSDQNNIFYINDKLIEEGYAQHPNKERRQDNVDSLYMPIVKYIHLFPTFLELEHGLAPSTGEMDIFHELNLPINFCYPQYFHFDHTEEQRIIVAAEIFHETHCLNVKRRSPSSRFFELNRFKAEEPDLTIFGELQCDIEDFLSRPRVKEVVDVEYEVFEDAEENAIHEEWEGVSHMLKKEEFTVNELKEDLSASEDIIRKIDGYEGIKSEVKQESVDDLSDEESEAYLSNHPLNILKLKRESPSDDGSEQEEYLIKSEEIEDVKLENISNNEKNNNNYDDLKLPDMRLKNIEFSFLDKENPLSIKNLLNVNMESGTYDFVCDKSCSSEVDSLKDNQIHEESQHENVKHSFSNKDNSLSNINLVNTEPECSISDLVRDKLFIDSSEIVDSPEDDRILEENQPHLPVNNTNPFLEDMNTNLEIDTTKLNPNNPFLNFLTNEDGECSDSSSSSTVYEYPVAKPTHSWSSFDDLSPEEISQLGRSLRSKTTSMDSLRGSEDRHSCSTQTSDLKTVGVQTATNYEHFDRQQQLAVGYPPWFGGYANPHYRVRFANFHGYTYEAQFPHQPARQPGPVYPPPPPGFSAEGRFSYGRGYIDPMQAFRTGGVGVPQQYGFSGQVNVVGGNVSAAGNVVPNPSGTAGQWSNND